jgi:hypothetical protein
LTFVIVRENAKGQKSVKIIKSELAVITKILCNLLRPSAVVRLFFTLAGGLRIVNPLAGALIYWLQPREEDLCRWTETNKRPDHEEEPSKTTEECRC